MHAGELRPLPALSPDELYYDEVDDLTWWRGKWARVGAPLQKFSPVECDHVKPTAAGARSPLR